MQREKKERKQKHTFFMSFMCARDPTVRQKSRQRGGETAGQTMKKFKNESGTKEARQKNKNKSKQA